MFVSFNDGDDWQSLQLNLPAVSVRDIAVKGDDVIVATHGRGFWVLDSATRAAAGRPGDGDGRGDAVQAGRRDPAAAGERERHAEASATSRRPRTRRTARSSTTT